MKKIAALAASALVGISSIAFAVPASAGTGECKLGYACLWENRSFDGRSYGKNRDGAVTPSMNNRASSAAANGNVCYATRFYDYANPVGGGFFILWSETKKGKNYKDPNLSNGAGWDVYGNLVKDNWEDRISYIMFTGGASCR
ncbi:peptidase inhibitor family I36 protein [Arcanobacterium canis]